MKRKISVEKIIRFCIYIIFIGLIIFSLVKVLNSGKKTVSVSVLEKIENYNYSLESNATEYYKSLFSDLSKLLSNEEYDIEEYAKLISKLFITDFYTLDNKLNKNDIGGLQYVYTDFIEDFSLLAQNSVYKTVKNNMYNDRNQELSIVKEVIVDSISSGNFKYNNNVLEAYYVNVSITYEKDLGHPQKVNLILVKNDKKLEVAKMETV